MAQAEAGKLLPLAVRGERGDVEALGVAGDDVERRIADRTGGAEQADPCAASSQEHQRQQRGRRHRGQQRVDAIEDAAVSGQQASAVLHARVPLQQRLEEVAHDRQRGEREREPDPDDDGDRR